MSRKQVVKSKPQPEYVELTELDAYRIYAIHTSLGIYKLQRLSFNNRSVWMFCAMRASRGWLSGRYWTLRGGVDAAMDGNHIVWQFETEKEFYEWALECTGM